MEMSTMSLDEYITIRQRNAEVILAAVKAKQDVAMYDPTDLRPSEAPDSGQE
jgi:hypothetical protein